jgi:hypothetical protein
MLCRGGGAGTAIFVAPGEVVKEVTNGFDPDFFKKLCPPRANTLHVLDGIVRSQLAHNIFFDRPTSCPSRNYTSAKQIDALAKFC